MSSIIPCYCDECAHLDEDENSVACGACVHIGAGSEDNYVRSADHVLELDAKIASAIASERSRCMHAAEAICVAMANAERVEMDKARAEGRQEAEGFFGHGAFVADELNQAIYKAINADSQEDPIEAERERCAGICDEAADLYNYKTAKECARRIRGEEIICLDLMERLGYAPGTAGIARMIGHLDIELDKTIQQDKESAKTRCLALAARYDAIAAKAQKDSYARDRAESCARACRECAQEVSRG